MKSKLFTLIASAATLASAHAFTIDFNTMQISGVDNGGNNVVSIFEFDKDPGGDGAVTEGAGSVTLSVLGYGNVLFEVPLNSADFVDVARTYSNDGNTTFQSSLELDPGETIRVTFLGSQSINVNFDLIGVSAADGEDASVDPEFGETHIFTYAPGGTGDGAGISAISWNVVPEPSSSLMVLLGAGSLILRRRR